MWSPQLIQLETHRFGGRVGPCSPSNTHVGGQILLGPNRDRTSLVPQRNQLFTRTGPDKPLGHPPCPKVVVRVEYVFHGTFQISSRDAAAYICLQLRCLLAAYNIGPIS